MNLQRLLGLDLPIIQAPMAGVQDSALAVAVSNAGGLGSLPCAMLDIKTMSNELAAIKAQTFRPFNVNFFCHTPPVPDDEREAAWRAALSPYYEEYGIDPVTIPAGPGTLQFRSRRCSGGVQARSGELSFWFAVGRIAGASESIEHQDTVFSNDCRGSVLARSTGGRCHYCPVS